MLSIYANGAQIVQVAWPHGETVPITHDTPLTYEDLGATTTAFSTVISAVRIQRQADIWISIDGNPATDILVRTGNYFGLAWTRSWSLISQTADDEGKVDLWSIVPRTGSSHRLTSDPYVEESPVASPDGKYLVYGSKRNDGTVHIWRLDQDSANPVQLTSGPAHDQFPDITSDSKEVYFSSSRSGHDAIWKVSIKGSINGGEPELFKDWALKPSISPDGKKIACLYSETPGGPFSYSLLDIATRQKIASFASIPAETNVRWSNDGKDLLYILDRNGVSNVWAQPADGGNPQQRTHYTEGRIFALAPAPHGSPYGQALALIRGNNRSGLVMMQLER